MDLGGVLVVVLITELWKGVDEGNKITSLWELMKEIVDHGKYDIIFIKKGDYTIYGI
jgi:hypothetical protein